jgi:hypothetical protein
MYIIFIYIFEKEKRTFAADTGITKNLDKKKKEEDGGNFFIKL